MDPLPKGRKRKMTRRQILAELEKAVKDKDKDKRPKFIFIRDDEGAPRVTLCDIQYNDSKYRGISICSFRDVPKKKTGKRIALDRAIAAIISGRNILPVRREEAFDALAISGIHLESNIYKACLQ